MRFITKSFALASLGLALLSPVTFAQTDGSARMAVTINDYNGSSANHWTVVWVTTEAGAFIKTLRKQGTSYGWTSGQWNTHTPQWNAARGGTSGSQVVDGYTSATATSYSGTNSPIILTWNCRNTNNVLVADGNYKFWVQYAEDSGAGPYTTNGLLWTKGPAGVTTNYANKAPNFTSMQASWTPSTPPPVAPTITSAAPPATGTVGVPYAFTSTAAGTAPIRFSATGLPPGLTQSLAGTISGIPTTGGSFPGTITATNGTLPNASQPFVIAIGTVPVIFDSVSATGNSLVLGGAGPANGVYAVLNSTNLAQWTPTATNTFNAAGRFGFTNTFNPSQPQGFYRLRVP